MRIPIDRQSDRAVCLGVLDDDLLWFNFTVCIGVPFIAQTYADDVRGLAVP